MKCHKCPHLDSIQRGDYVSKPWKDTPCAQCKLVEDTFYSVPFDEEEPGRTAGFQPALSDFSERTAGVPPAPSSARCSLPSEEMLPAAVFSSAIQGLLSLDPILRDIVAWRYQGLPYKEIEARQGTSVQLAEMRHKRALRDWPELEALFPLKVAKQSRRKTRR
jgi:hypothetical protein